MNTETEDIRLELTFNGESCTYKGSTDLKSGPVTLLFNNASEKMASANLLKHTGDQTIQDAIDYIGEGPTTKHHPYWTEEIQGVWTFINAGDSHTFKGDLEPGIYHVVCVGSEPIAAWFGVGLTVEK